MSIEDTRGSFSFVSLEMNDGAANRIIASADSVGTQCTLNISWLSVDSSGLRVRRVEAEMRGVLLVLLQCLCEGHGGKMLYICVDSISSACIEIYHGYSLYTYVCCDHSIFIHSSNYIWGQITITTFPEPYPNETPERENACAEGI